MRAVCDPSEFISSLLQLQIEIKYIFLVEEDIFFEPLFHVSVSIQPELTFFDA